MAREETRRIVINFIFKVLGRMLFCGVSAWFCPAVARWLRYRQGQARCGGGSRTTGWMWLVILAGLIVVNAPSYASNAHNSSSKSQDAQSKYDEIRVSALKTYMQGLRAYRAGQYSLAEAELSKLIKPEHTDLAALSIRGLARGKLGRFREAMEDHDRAIELSRGAALAYDHRGETQQEAGHLSEAIADYTKAVHGGTGMTKVLALYHRGAVLLTWGRLQEALGDLNESVRLNAGFILKRPEPLYYRALAKERLGDLAGAMVDLQFARKICIGREPLSKDSHLAEPSFKNLLEKINAKLSESQYGKQQRR